MATVAPVYASNVLLKSTFEAGDDGWTVGDLFGSRRGWLPDYASYGGEDDDGFIRTEDVYGFNAFHAPASWLGNKISFYNGLLRVSQRAASTDGARYPLVVIGSGNIRLQWRPLDPPSAQWTVYEVALNASAGWEIADGSGNPGQAATDSLMIQALSNLEWLALDADWQTGDDQVDLDSVEITTPEPSSALLAATALGAAIVIHLRRRQASERES